MTDERIEDITAEEFWGHYFSGTAREMTRGSIGMTASVPADVEPDKKSILDAMRPGRQVRVSRSSLEDYYYLDDPRFARIGASPDALQASLLALETGTYEWRITPPLARERTVESGKVLFDTLSERGDITLDALHETLKDALETAVPDMRGEMLTLVWLVGEQRDVSSGPPLIHALSVVTGDSLAADILGGKGRDALLTALFQSNPKIHIDALLDVMEGMNDTDKFAVRQLLITLFSQEAALGVPAIPEGTEADYQNPEFWENIADDSDPDYWREVIGSFGAVDQDTWDRHDAKALHWEIRWLAALRMDSGERESLTLLAEDEVTTVADKARERLAER